MDLAAAQLRAHDAASAFAVLAPLEESRAGDPAFDRLFGVASLDSGHLTRAIFALERLLALRPDDRPARAELARAYLAAGETDAGRRELELARRGALPDAAAAAIDRVLALVDQVSPRRGPRVSGYLEAGAGWDSNVNSATNVGQLAIPAFGGLLFTVAPGNTARHDAVLTAAAGSGVQWDVGHDIQLLAGVNARTGLNRHAHDVDVSLADASVGAGHTHGADAQTLALQTDRAWLSSQVYRTSTGASAQWQHQFGKASQLSAFGQWARQDYAHAHDRDTDRTVLGAAAAHSFALQGSLVYGSVYAADEHARHSGDAYHGHHALGLRAGTEQPVGQRTVFAEWQHERRRYGGDEPLFDRRRADRQDDLIAGIRQPLAPRWQLTPQIHYTRAAANVALYDYTRTVVQIMVRRELD